MPQRNMPWQSEASRLIPTRYLIVIVRSKANSNTGLRFTMADLQKPNTLLRTQPTSSDTPPT